jgi:prevent-host-death family protein
LLAGIEYQRSYAWQAAPLPKKIGRTCPWAAIGLVYSFDQNGALLMDKVSAYEAKTHLPRLLRAAERGESVIITRHGKPVAQLGPVADQRQREDVTEVIARMKRARAQRARVTVAEILSARDEGRQP